jgi:formate dehydrogenase major subunit
MANNRPAPFIWCMGGTQHTNGNNNTRAYCVLQLALGNMGVAGGGTNIFRGHDNVQGATDLGVLSHTLPGYYGLSTRVLEALGPRLGREDYRLAEGPLRAIRRKGRQGQADDEPAGIPVSRWIDGVLEDKENIDQPDNVRAMVLLGPRAQLADPRPGDEEGDGEAGPAGRHRPVSDRLGGHARPHRRRLPAAGLTQFETHGSVTASNRSLQWREKGDRSAVRVAARPHHHVQARQEVRLRRAVQATSRWRTTSR